MAKIGIRLPKIGNCLVINYGNMALSARWHLLESHREQRPRIFRWCEQCLELVICSNEDLFQGCPPRPHHPRIWGFLLPADCDCAGEDNDQLRRSKSQLGGNAEEWRKRAAKSAPLHEKAGESMWLRSESIVKEDSVIRGMAESCPPK